MIEITDRTLDAIRDNALYVSSNDITHEEIANMHMHRLDSNIASALIQLGVPHVRGILLGFVESINENSERWDIMHQHWLDVMEIASI